MCYTGKCIESIQADVIQIHATALNATGHLVSNATDKDKQVILHISHSAISRTYKPQIQGTHIGGYMHCGIISNNDVHSQYPYHVSKAQPLQCICLEGSWLIIIYVNTF